MRIIAEVLKKIAYDGIVTIETVPRLQGFHYPESDEKIIQTLEYWKNLMK